MAASQVFLDSPALYTSGTISSFWKGGSNNANVVTSPLPPSSQVGAQVIQLNVSSSTAWVQSDNYGNHVHLCVGTRFYRSGANGVVLEFIAPNGLGGIYHICSVTQDNSGTYLNVGQGLTVVATGAVVPQSHYNQYELDVVFSSSGTGTMTLYLNGNPTPFLSATGLTMPSAVATGFTLGSANPGSSNTPGGYYADTYLFAGLSGDTIALAPQGLGAAKTGYALPNGVGAIANWTANGAATIWQCLNTVPAPGDTTYASDANPGDQFMVTVGSIPAIQTLIGVELCVSSREDDAGPRSYQSGFYKGGTYAYSGVDQYMGGTYTYAFDQYYPNNPITSALWAPSDLPGLQIGGKLTH